jgi:hypothetical protein
MRVSRGTIVRAYDFANRAEAVAAATRRPIDAILAHAGTNLALGCYVLATGNWWLM